MTDIAERNRAAYNAPDVVEYYGAAHALQKPEATILELLRSRLGAAHMLDLGVGGGRTTAHFAPLVSRYVGVDFAADMIEACKKRFAGEPWEFVVGDARALDGVAASSFDFVLFSHSGIDYVGTHDDRLRVLAEVKRVSKPGAAFCFSTHNLQRVPDLFGAPPGVLRRLFTLPRRARLRAHNPEWRSYGSLEHTILNDGAMRFRVVTYHITPGAQVRQLGEAGFGEVRVFSVATGRELSTAEAETNTEPWLYYLATA